MPDPHPDVEKALRAWAARGIEIRYCPHAPLERQWEVLWRGLSIALGEERVRGWVMIDYLGRCQEKHEAVFVNSLTNRILEHLEKKGEGDD